MFTWLSHQFPSWDADYFSEFRPSFTGCYWQAGHPSANKWLVFGPNAHWTGGSTRLTIQYSYIVTEENAKTV